MLPEWLDIIIRTLVSLSALFLIAKLSGPRQIAQLTFYDYIFGITVGSVAAAVAIDTSLPLYGGLLSLIIYCGFTLLMSLLTEKSILCRRFISGNPEILFYNGMLIEKQLRKCKLDIQELTGLARNRGFYNLNEVSCIIMETNGTLSFLPKSESRPLTPRDLQIKPAEAMLAANIIIDGNIMEHHLKAVGKDKQWLEAVLKNQSLKAKDILLATADRNGNFKAYPKQKNRQNLDFYN